MYFYTYKFIYIMWNIFASICLSFSGSNYFLPVHRQCKWNPASILRFTAIFVGEWEGGRGQWPNYSALPGRERSKYWFNSRTVTNTDSSFYGRRVNPREKRGLTPNIVLRTHIRLILYFNAGRHSLKGD